MVRRLVAAMLLCVAPVMAEEVEIVIWAPVPGQPALGEVDLDFSVYAAGAMGPVEVKLDGQLIKRFEAPPYEMTVELGTRNQSHRIEVIATDANGMTGRAEVTTEAIPDSGQFDISLQQLYVTATKKGSRVLDLEVGDFRVKDKGDRQEIVTFARGDIPFTAVLLIDASSSMRGERLAAAGAGARSFVERAAELDQISLLAFSDTLLAKTGFDRDAAAVEETLAATEARGGTAIHDHLYMALKMLEKRQGRRVAILLSDGVDSHSVLEIEDVLRTARRSQTLVYWIWLTRQESLEFKHGRMRTIYSTWHSTDEYKQQFEILQKLVHESGGRIVPVSRIDEIEGVFVDILSELREQYVLGYYPSNERNDGQWHPVDVDVRGSGIDVRTHEGYIDF